MYYHPTFKKSLEEAIKHLDVEKIKEYQKTHPTCCGGSDISTSSSIPSKDLSPNTNYTLDLPIDPNSASLCKGPPSDKIHYGNKSITPNWVKEKPGIIIGSNRPCIYSWTIQIDDDRSNYNIFPKKLMIYDLVYTKEYTEKGACYPDRDGAQHCSTFTFQKGYYTAWPAGTWIGGGIPDTNTGNWGQWRKTLTRGLTNILSYHGLQISGPTIDDLVTRVVAYKLDNQTKRTNSYSDQKECYDEINAMMKTIVKIETKLFYGRRPKSDINDKCSWYFSDNFSAYYTHTPSDRNPYPRLTTGVLEVVEMGMSKYCFPTVIVNPINPSPQPIIPINPKIPKTLTPAEIPMNDIWIPGHHNDPSPPGPPPVPEPKYDDFWAWIQEWLDYLQLSQEEFILINIGAIGVSFVGTPPMLIPYYGITLFSKLAKSYVETTLIESKWFMNEMDTIVQWFSRKVVDAEFIVKWLVDVAYWNMLGIGALLAVPWISYEIPFLTPIVMEIQIGIALVLGIYDIGEFLVPILMKKFENIF